MWYTDIYVGESINDKEQKKIIRKINKHKKMDNIYCVLMSEKNNFQLEIMDTKELYFEEERGTEPLVIGIARTKLEAFELTRDIVQVVFEETEEVKLKNFFGCGV